MKKTQRFFSNILGISEQSFSASLMGKRNLGFQNARKVSAVLQTSIEVWLDKDLVHERQASWGKFKEKK